MSLDVDLIIFDWGGTLADVCGQDEALQRGVRAVGEILAEGENGQAVESLARLATTAEQRAAADPEHREVDIEELLGRWASQRGYAVSRERIEAAVEAIGHHWVGGALAPLPGALEAVETLCRAGYRLGLLSNCWIPAPFCRLEFERQGFAEFFDFAVFSSGVTYRKPSLVTYEAALMAAYPDGWPTSLSRVLFVGDSPSCDVIGPARMGIRTALVSSRPGIWPAEDFDRAEPDLRIDSVAELPRVLGCG